MTEESRVFEASACSESIQIRETENKCGGADKSVARPGRKQATATEDFEFHISYL